MKKTLAVLTILVLVLSIFDNLYAYETPTDIRKYSNAYKLYEHWEENGYPDNVGGVFSTDGSSDNLTILHVNDDGSKENLIREALSDNSGVSFGSAKYSHNEMKSIRDEIERNYLGKNEKFYGIGIGWTSVDGIVTGFGEEGKEFRVVVQVDKSILTEYTNKFSELYGDRVVVEEGEQAVLLEEARDEITLENKNIENNTAWLLSLSIIIVVLVVASTLLKKKRV